MTMTTSTESCCPEFAGISRRGLFKGAVALTAATTTVLGSAVVRASAAPANATARAVLVVLSMRGAADGLSLVVPHSDADYYAARPRIAVPAAQLLFKNDTFGLHPELAPLVPLFEQGRMAAVHATGLPSPNRSHFAAMEEVEDANPGSSVREGWLNRLIGTDSNDSPLQGFNLAAGVPPTSLYGDQPIVSAGSVDAMSIPGDDEWDPNGRRVRSLHRLWDSSNGPMGKAMRSTFRAVAAFQPVRDTAENPKNGAVYPENDLGRALREVARIVRGDVGVEVVTVDQGDWDHHTGLGTIANGRMKDNAADLAHAIAAFFTDLGNLGDKVTLVTMSEFGRRVKENANQGLDHGYGNVMFLAGGGVKGGYYGTMPDLRNETDADLTVTTDYRSVLSEVVSSRFGASPASVFPGFVNSTTVGVMNPATPG
jgi:uncharacterized protein (DUF1501 family)